MRALYKMIDGKLTEITNRAPEGAGARVHLISDDIPETWNPVDGKHYTSKSAIRRVAKERGLIEVGNEQIKPKPYEHVSIREDYERAETLIKSRR